MLQLSGEMAQQVRKQQMLADRYAPWPGCVLWALCSSSAAPLPLPPGPQPAALRTCPCLHAQEKEARAAAEAAAAAQAAAAALQTQRNAVQAEEQALFRALQDVRKVRGAATFLPGACMRMCRSWVCAAVWEGRQRAQPSICVGLSSGVQPPAPTLPSPRAFPTRRPPPAGRRRGRGRGPLSAVLRLCTVGDGVAAPRRGARAGRLPGLLRAVCAAPRPGASSAAFCCPRGSADLGAEAKGGVPQAAALAQAAGGQGTCGTAGTYLNVLPPSSHALAAAGPSRTLAPCRRLWMLWWPSAGPVSCWSLETPRSSSRSRSSRRRRAAAARAGSGAPACPPAARPAPRRQPACRSPRQGHRGWLAGWLVFWCCSSHYSCYATPQSVSPPLAQAAPRATL